VLTTILQDFVRSAAARNLTVLPILFPDLGTAAYTDHTAVEAAAKASTGQCAKIMTDLGLAVFEIGQEWDNEALFPGAGGDKPSEYNQTVYQHLLATLRCGIRPFLSRFLSWKNDLFTKISSGQTWETLR
jgi:hypothetical protein